MKRRNSEENNISKRSRALKITAVLILSASALFTAYNSLVRPPQYRQLISYPDSGQQYSGRIYDSQTDAADTANYNIGKEPESAAPARYRRKELCYTFLLAASDQTSGNADVIMAAMYDTVNQKIGIVSVPRDTLIYRSYPKINAVYQRGVEELRGTVSDMLGIPIDFYISVDIEGFCELVDTVGGVDFYIPCHMSYDDPTQDLSIHFEEGMRHLSGEEAMKVCRWRKNSDGTGGYLDADISRTKLQQRLLQVIAKKALSNPQKLFDYINLFIKYVKTDLSASDTAWFAQKALGFKFADSVTAATLPGNGTVEYNGAQYCYQLYPSQALDIVNSAVNPYQSDITLSDMNIFIAQ